MSFMSFRDKWLDWNLLGKGKPTGRDGRFRYDRNVFYEDGVAKQRFMRDGREPIVLIWTGTSVCGIHPAKPDVGVPRTRSFVPGNRVRSIYVPDIGVFSRFEGDQMTDDDLHDRLKYVFLMEARSYCEEKIETQVGKILAETIWKRGSLIAGLQAQYERWNEYNYQFRCYWEDLPEIYMQQAGALIDRKVEAFEDPKAVAQRERARARKLAKEYVVGQ